MRGVQVQHHLLAKPQQVMLLHGRMLQQMLPQFALRNCAIADR